MQAGWVAKNLSFSKDSKSKEFEEKNGVEFEIDKANYTILKISKNCKKLQKIVKIQKILKS